MLISELNNRDEVISTVIKELNGIGIKIRNEKQKQTVNKKRNKKIFNVSLHLLELDDGLLSNGSVAQVPKFVLMACKRLQTELETEGLFRKTGSVKKQKMIQEQLEKGGVLEKNHSVLDVANLLKTFFRELPEPLIPPGVIQEGLLRCLFHFGSYEEKVDAILMLMLLLPPISVNTLAYFLQFLEVVIKNANTNLMSTDNLVKVLTPTIMPVPLNAPQKRLTSHFKVVELLIENANLLGVVPDRMCRKEIAQIVPPMTEERKKKKRRSGSIGRSVFNGFRKMVGAIGSSESLDRSEEGLDDDVPMTPIASKSSKKRPLDRLDISTTFSSKKKKDLLMTLTSLPEIDDPNSPSNNKKDSTKKRKSVGSHGDKESGSPTKRRWSIGKFHRSKHLTVANDSHDEPDKAQAAVAEEDFVKIPKSEYEAFKDRLISIETKISHEFNMTKLDAVKAEMDRNDSMHLNGPEKVENKFNKTLQEVEKLEDSERNTDHLARRLSRDLKIRPSLDHAIMRSPSARKIGSLRRRRDSATRLSRTQSWHLGQSSPGPLKKPQDDVSKVVTSASFYPKCNLKRTKHFHYAVQPTARPLPTLPASTEKVIPEKPLRVKRESTDHFVTPMKVATKPAEVWTPATDFFNEAPMEVDSQHKPKNDEMFFKTPNRPRRLSSSRSASKNEGDLQKTPMLPPRLTPAKKFTSSVSTPMSAMNFSAINKSLTLTPSMHDVSTQGRESIIILRNQNAGMVAQKARLFNGMADVAEKPAKVPRVIVNKNLELVKGMACDETPSKKSSSSRPRSPRRSSRSPSGIQKRNHFKATSQSPLLRTIRECGGSQKAKLLKSDILNEIASPKARDDSRKPLSQSNTPRSVTPRRKTPSRDSGKKRRQTPSKSPRFVRRIQTSD